MSVIQPHQNIQPETHPQPAPSYRQNVRLEEVELDGYFTSRQGEPERAHIRNLVQAIRNNGALSPIKLWLDESDPNAKLILLDGYHRLQAYQSAGWNKLIPSKVIKCSKRTALLIAAAANSKDKLPLNYSEKADIAWRLVRETDANYTKKEIAKATGVSMRTVATMRSRWKVYEAEQKEPSGNWRRDQMDNPDYGADVTHPTEAQRAAEVKALAKEMIAVVGRRARYDEQFVADVLQETFGYRLRNMADYLYGDVDEWADIPIYEYQSDDEDEELKNANF